MMTLTLTFALTFSRKRRPKKWRHYFRCMSLHVRVLLFQTRSCVSWARGRSEKWSSVAIWNALTCPSLSRSSRTWKSTAMPPNSKSTSSRRSTNATHMAISTKRQHVTTFQHVRLFTLLLFVFVVCVCACSTGSTTTDTCASRSTCWGSVSSTSWWVETKLKPHHVTVSVILCFPVFRKRTTISRIPWTTWSTCPINSAKPLNVRPPPPLDIPLKKNPKRSHSHNPCPQRNSSVTTDVILVWRHDVV